MRARRPAHLPAAIDAVAERLPFPDGSFDAAMATFTVHQWAQLARGLAEMRRVTRGPVALLTCDPAQLRTYWLDEYAPEAIDTEASRYPPLAALADGLGGAAATPFPSPWTAATASTTPTTAGRRCSLMRRLAWPGLACSARSFVAPEAIARFEKPLARDLAGGAWDARHGRLRRQPFLNGSLALVVSDPKS